MPTQFLTYEQQIDKLVNEKNLVVNDREAAMSALRDIGYFALINGYKWPLRNPMTRKYEDGTRFEDILALYHFDDDMRVLLSGCFWRVERKLRNAVAHSFCERFGTGQGAYLDAANYSAARSARRDVRRLLGILEYHANDNMQHEYLVHQRTRHGNVPLWATLNAMTFGQVSKMYELLHPGVKAAVAKQFANVNERQLANVLKVLVLFRNVCVHNERLFSHKVHSDIFDTPLHAKLGIPKAGNEYVQGKHDLFAVVIALRYLLPSPEFLAFKRGLSRLIDGFVARNAIIDEARLLDLMGFPANWKSMTRYKLR